MHVNEMPDVSIILPVYNEADSIGSVIAELVEALADWPREVEILAVDDGSTDETSEILARLPYGHLRVLTITPNSGQSAAFGVGFRAAESGILVTMDADGQNDPRDIPRLVEGLDGADVCCGVRRNRRDGFHRRAAGRLGNGCRNLLLRSRIQDAGCSLKAFRSEWLADVRMWDGAHRFLVNMLEWKGARIRQIPVNHRPRERGRSKYTNTGRLFKTLPDLIAMCWLRSRQRRFDVRPAADKRGPFQG